MNAGEAVKALFLEGYMNGCITTLPDFTGEADMKFHKTIKTLLMMGTWMDVEYPDFLVEGAMCGVYIIYSSEVCFPSECQLFL